MLKKNSVLKDLLLNPFNAEWIYTWTPPFLPPGMAMLVFGASGYAFAVEPGVDEFRLVFSGRRVDDRIILDTIEVEHLH